MRTSNAIKEKQTYSEIMNTNKTITIIYKHLNFKNDGKGKAKLFKSLAHSLRISPTNKNRIKQTKILEWDENLAHTNLIYSPLLGTKALRLNTLTEEQKVQIQNSFIIKVNDEQNLKDKCSESLDALRKYKAKINKWYNSLTGGSDSLKGFLLKIINEKEAIDVRHMMDVLGQFEFARKNQKTATFEKYLELHNHSIKNRSDISRSKIIVQEAFFKIPKRNGVEVSTTDLITNIHLFYKNNFPDYPIKLIVFHGDEIGHHPHIFVDARNRRTGKYDLLTAQKNFVNDNIDKLKSEYPDAEPLDFSKREYLTKKLQAQYFQSLFYQHTNLMLDKYNIQAKKLEKTIEHNARMAVIEEDAKKPKIERAASFWNKQIIDLTEKLNNQRGGHRTLLNEKIKLENQIKERISERTILDELISLKNEKLNSFRTQFEEFALSVSDFVLTFFKDLSRDEVNKRKEKAQSSYEILERKLDADELIEKLANNLNAKNASTLRSVKNTS